MKRLEEQLQQPVDMHELATRYGLDYGKLTKTIGEQVEIGEDKKAMRDARRNLSVLKNIERYLQTTRAAMRIQGNKVHLVLDRFPGPLLTIEEKRCESLRRAGRRSARDYTKLSGHAIYRCPVPGCGGATINPASIPRSTAVHFRAFHRDIEAIFVIRIELRNGWEYIQVPEQEFNVQIVQTEDAGEETALGKDMGAKGRTCAKLAPYKGKASVQICKENNEPDSRKGGGNAADKAQLPTREKDGEEGPERRAAGTDARKGVFRIAPGPLGSGIREVADSNRGGATKSHEDQTAMTAEECEQQILKKVMGKKLKPVNPYGGIQVQDNN